MTQTQLASMYLGNPHMADRDERLRGVSSQINATIHILDGQSNQGIILDYITAKNIINDTHRRSLTDTLETYNFITFADKRFSQYLEKRNRIIMPDEDGTLREFVIFEAAKYKDTEGHKAQVYSHASYLELKKSTILHPSTFEGTATQHGGRYLNDTGWQVGIVESSGTRTLTIEKHTNPYEMLKRIAKEFELELRFRIEHDGNKVTGRYVDMLERVGEWRGREVEFGKDLDGIRRVEKQDIVTALLGIGPEDEEGNRLEVLVEDEDALRRWGREDEYGELHHLIEPYEIQSERDNMTTEEARQYTRTALNKRINTSVTYECTIIDLENAPGMENKKIRHGDTIRIKDTHFNPPLYLEARVFESDRSIKSKAKKDIKLGDYIEFTEDEVNELFNELRKEIQERLNRLAMATITSTAGNIFKNAEGTTDITAVTFVNGSENDEDGSLYDYQWMRFDKDGEHDTDFYEEGKTIEVTASDIDVKATYRVLVAYELKVITMAEMTISNVFDGSDGDQGPEGPKGDDGEVGQGIDDVTPEYYKSDSDTSQTGGEWSESKPTWEPDKYLWTRDKITYKNPYLVEHTSPVIDDSWQAITTADGKNTVFYQDDEPSTEGRKIGDTWFDTSNDNRMSRFNGSEWVLAQFGEQAIVADSITANHIKSLVGLNVNDQFIVDNNGNVHFGGDLQGPSGTFGRVSVNEGDITFKDEQSSTEFSLISKVNLLKDHSFELVPPDHDSLDSDSVLHNWLDAEGNNPYPMFDESPWERVRQPKVSVPFGADSKDALAIFGYKAIIIRNRHYVRQYVSEGISANSQYTLSAHFKRQWQSPTGGTPVLQVWHVSAMDGSRLQQLESVVFPAVRSDYVYERHSLTFTVPNSFTLGDSVEIIVSGGNDNWIQCDGAQLVEGDIAVPYDPEDSIWELTRGNYETSNQMRSLWSGTYYPRANQTATPTKRLSKCQNGWIIKWQNYDVGSGTTNSNFEYVFIPKYHAMYHEGAGLRITLGRSGTATYSKYLYIYDDQIVGHDSNGDGDMRDRVMTEVLEW